MRAWQRMLSGRRLDLIEPSPVDIEIEDIAHGLSRVARWNGQTTGEYPFSVAQHSMLVEQLCLYRKKRPGPEWQLIALLHDAPEYVIGDMISPFKAVLGLDYKVFESKLESAIHIRFGLPAMMPDACKKMIKRADHGAAYLEATQLAGFNHTESRKFFGKPPENHQDITLTPQAPDDVKAQFIRRFEEILHEMEKAA